MKPRVENTKWLCLGYTDDGCYRYKCLACNKQWEARTDAADWQFCPYCGVRWTGTAGATNADRFGPRRRRIFEATRGHWKPWKPPFYWVIETRATWEGETPGRWDFDQRLDGFRPLKEVYRFLQMTKVECRHRTSESKGKIVWEYRIRTLRGLA